MVSSECNFANVLTRVPQKWFRKLTEGGLSSPETSSAVSDSLSAEQIAEIHHNTGHHGVRRTLYFVQKVNPSVTRKEVQCGSDLPSLSVH